MSSPEKRATLCQILVSFTIGYHYALPYDSIVTELPILVQRLPEYWDLPVVFGFGYAVAAALTSVIVLILMKFTAVSDVLHRHKPELLLSLGILKVILLALMVTSWDSASTVFGRKYSVAFQMISMLMVSAGTMDFLFGLPYVGTFPPRCMPAFYVGMSCSGTVYGFITFLQGAGEFDCVNKTQNATQFFTNGNKKDRNIRFNFTDEQQEEAVFIPPLFTVETYFGIVMSMSLCCCALLLGHVVLLRLRPTSYVTETIRLITRDDADSSKGEGVAQQLAESDNRNPELKHKTFEQTLAISAPERSPSNDCRGNAVIVTVYACLIGGMFYGASQPMMTYATLPYGNSIFGLSRRLSSAVSPLGSIACALFPTQSIRTLSLIFGTYATLCIYVCTVAVMSPTPPLVSTHPEIGGGLVVSSYILLPIIRCYLRAALATTAAELGQSTLEYYSLIQELTIAVLVIPSFVCIDILKLLTDIPHCS